LLVVIHAEASLNYCRQTNKETSDSMNEDVILTVYVVIDDVMKGSGHQSDIRASLTDAEVLSIAVLAALYFQNHHERAVYVLPRMGYFRHRLSASRFNRRLHQLAGWLPMIISVLSELSKGGTVYIIDSIPMPVCRRVRAGRCKKVRGRVYCGWCAAKKERFFGWRLHLICTPHGLPVAFEMLPAAFHDLTPIHELTFALPEEVTLFADKAYNTLAEEKAILDDISVRLLPVRRKNMKQHHWMDQWDLGEYRHSIETTNSQLEKMGIERLYARTNLGFDIKVHASLLALACTNWN
jgi:hypothetical protein